MRNVYKKMYKYYTTGKNSLTASFYINIYYGGKT